MQFSFKFSSLLINLAVATTLATGVVGAAVKGDVFARESDASYVISEAEFLHWLATTDAELTFIGEPINPLTKRSAQNTMVTYCSNRVDNVCGGPCTVYNGGATCLSAPGTSCLAATNNVGFCDRGGCGGSCNELNSCGTRLDGGFCFTPGTASILVSSL